MVDLKLGFTDDGDVPDVADPAPRLRPRDRGLRAGANGPLLVAMALPNPTPPNEAPSLAAVEKLVAALGTTPDVASVTPPIPSPANNAAIVLVTPKPAPNAAPTQALVETLRSTVIPAATAGTVSPVRCSSAVRPPRSSTSTDRIVTDSLLCIGAVILAAFLLLMMVFRSMLVPLKAAVMNLLSIGAAYGVIVAVFQWGWGRELIGLASSRARSSPSCR